MKLRLLIILSLFTYAVNAQENAATAEETIYDSTAGLQTQPQYPGGIDAFYSDVLSNFKMPNIKEKMHVKIHVSFVVEKDGTMSNIKVIRDPGHGLGAAAIKALKKMKKKWAPGIQNGKAVRAMFTLPFAINID